MNRLHLFLIFFLISFKAQTQSVLSSGDWYKIEIEERGVYKLTFRDLRNAGVPVNSINPQTIKVYTYLAGTLPQANNIDRPYDPFQIPISVRGENDGNFDNDDYVLFYAQSASTYSYQSGSLEYHHNPYDNVNYYFITYGGEQGERIASISSLDGNFPVINSYDDFKYYEREQNNILTSGREWYSERFSTTTNQSYTFDFENIIAGSEVNLSVAVMAQAFQNSSFTVADNNGALGTIEVPSIPNFNNDFGRYAIKGRDRVQQFTTTAPSSNQLEFELEYQKNNDFSIGYLNYLLVETKNDLSFNNSQLHFRSIESTSNTTSKFQLKNADANIKIWDITYPDAPKAINHKLNNGLAEFAVPSESIYDYIAFDESNNNPPISISQISNQNLKSLTDVEFLIISHGDFLSHANRLAAFRQSNDGLISKTVVIDKVYNEFSGGRQDVTAIRDLAKYLYDNGSLKYLLLFGRGSYDYKNIRSNNTNYVPIYESRNSLEPLDTYASDDYFGFLEEDEGEWLEFDNGAHTLDIGVGRLPVTNQQEAQVVVDKIINYATNPETIGKWRNDIVFVADDEDFNLHQGQADELTVFVDTTYSAFQPYKFYLDNFPQVSKPSGETSPKASAALDDKVNEGALIVNFTGHGGVNGWMQEQVLDIVQIQNWTNYNRLPLFVTATCEFGRHDDPQRISAGELVVTSEKGGGIAIVSTCRPVSSASNFNLNKAFYEVVYTQENGEYLRLGDIFRLTKNNENANSVGNRNFALLGDPTVRLSYPKKQIEIVSINDKSSKTDTLKAQSKVSLGGEIKFNNQRDQAFNGTVEFVVYDKEVERVTLGNAGNNPFTYKSKENIVFRGSSSVSGGEFTIDFIVPKNISYKIGNGKINMYAYSDNMEDANGSDISLLIGSSSNTIPSDESGPEILLNMGDTLNTDLSRVSHNTNLIVELQDESGINLSGFGVGNNITATLDDEQTFILNEYYEAKKDSYSEGLIVFPIEGLTKGPHKITVRASDVHNNTSESTISFNVADPNQIVIYEIKNYPNPFSNQTNFAVKHNRAGETLDVVLDIISPLSGLVLSKEIRFENSPSNLEFFQWNGETSNRVKLTPGLYIYQITLRSTRDGAKNTARQKLMLIN